jgi:hypothetical protein
VLIIFSKEFAARLASRIDPNSTHVNGAYYLSDGSLNPVAGGFTGTKGNTHISVIGPGDDMVSVTL